MQQAHFLIFHLTWNYLLISSTQFNYIASYCNVMFNRNQRQTYPEIGDDNLKYEISLLVSAHYAFRNMYSNTCETTFLFFLFCIGLI